MMDHRIPMTATSIRANAGGTMAVAARIIEKNREKIEEYNESLTAEEKQKGRDW